MNIPNSNLQHTSNPHHPHSHSPPPTPTQTQTQMTTSTATRLPAHVPSPRKPGAHLPVVVLFPAHRRITHSPRPLLPPVRARTRTRDSQRNGPDLLSSGIIVPSPSRDRSTNGHSQSHNHASDPDRKRSKAYSACINPKRGKTPSGNV